MIFQHGDGTVSVGFIDLYRRACYVLECKQTGLTLATPGWDKAMLRAHGQAVQYVRAVPITEGRPPFVVVVDVGRSIELYSEFSRSGGAYIPYPDPRAHRLRLDDLRRPEIRARLRAVWLDPLASTPAAAPPASPATSPPGWRAWPSRWRPPATPRRSPPPSSSAASSPCSPRTWGC